MGKAGDILFVYNVDLTLFALVSDFVRRLRDPETYPCRLCDLTYDRFTMKRAWKQFIETLPGGVRFELRDRFQRRFPAYADVPLPAVFRVHAAGVLSTLLSAEQINGATTIEALQAMIAAALCVDRQSA